GGRHPRGATATSRFRILFAHTARAGGRLPCEPDPEGESTRVAARRAPGPNAACGRAPGPTKKRLSGRAASGTLGRRRFPVPLYEYVCTACTHQFEELVFGDAAAACPRCGGTRVERLMSVVSVGR